MTFSLVDYMRMLEPARADVFHAELASIINQDSVVVDLGAGFGHFAIYAAKLGARRVFAIETNPAIKVCEVLARKNGVADRITVIQADSRSLKLPEASDVLIADVRGSLPFFQDSIDVIEQACKSFLTPGGLVLPSGDDVFVCPVESQGFASRSMPVDFREFGLDYSALADFTRSIPVRTVGRDVRLLSTPNIWARLRHNHAGTTSEFLPLRFSIDVPGRLDGLLAWSKILFRNGRVLDNDPRGIGLPYGQAFFPFKESGILLEEGQEVVCELQPVYNRLNTQWCWNAIIDGSKRIGNNSITSMFLV